MARKTAADETQATQDEPTGVQKAEDEALEAAAESPEGYGDGGNDSAEDREDIGSAPTFEDTAPPDSEPGNDAQRTLDAATEREQALIERNQRRYELRTSGKSSAEVNDILADEAEEAQS